MRRAAAGRGTEAGCTTRCLDGDPSLVSPTAGRLTMATPLAVQQAIGRFREESGSHGWRGDGGAPGSCRLTCGVAAFCSTHSFTYAGPPLRVRGAPDERVRRADGTIPPGAGSASRRSRGVPVPGDHPRTTSRRDRRTGLRPLCPAATRPRPSRQLVLARTLLADQPLAELPGQPNLQPIAESLPTHRRSDAVGRLCKVRYPTEDFVVGALKRGTASGAEHASAEECWGNASKRRRFGKG